MSDIPAASNRNWPNFFIFGAGRSGTTSLYHYMNEHPDIFMSPVKEPRFFCFDFEQPGVHDYAGDPAFKNAIKTIDDYTALFEGAKLQKIRGEASPQYLGRPDSAARMKRYAPSAKLVATLRHPAKRALSHYFLMRREGREPLDTFSEVIADHDRRERSGELEGAYLLFSRYADNLAVFLDTFGAENIKVLIYEDFAKNPARHISDVYRFLGVDKSFQPDLDIVHNPTKRETAAPSIKRWLRNVRDRMVGSKTIDQQALSEDYDRERKEALVTHASFLNDYFESDIRKLEAMLDRDLSFWRLPETEGGPT